MEKITQVITLIVLVVVGGLFALDKAVDITNSGPSKEIKEVSQSIKDLNSKMDKLLARHGIGTGPNGAIGSEPSK